MKLIIFEGLDGSGKTSLIKSVQQELIKQGNEVVVIRGLGSSTIGNFIRETFLTHNTLHNLTRYFLSFANMIQTQEELIKPNLQTNKIILVDRWLGSNFSYRVYPSKIDKKYQIFNKLSKKFIKPDITIYLKIHPKLGLERKINQKNHQLDVIETNSLAYFQQVEKGYYEFLKKQNLGTKIILNNMNDKDAKFNQQYIIKKIGEIKNGNNN
ncbi:dTMP kinase ['Elaeagnus angustifolia' witches'-broom phytoplasma]|uniref:Thymidylate kinase n=1 Tax='Elaeagnus angustifolia' witches'-broom phytoplasma TaxID=1538355 RepID=A0ABS5V962_9MOLU|nr:dTMP kinase ['Elaeagnus angustifolia' witches'-broom phytoplasma]MCX2955764.1 dTMP kinase [Candidatus Phytoplasma australiense]